MLVFFAIFPPKEISDKIDLFRMKYGKRHEKLAPHITIVPPFSPKKDLKTGVLRLSKAIKDTEPFHIQLSGFGSFNRKLNSVSFVDVVDSSEIIDFQNECFKVLDKYGAKKGKYKKPDFHITIAKRLRFPKLGRINEDLSKVSFNESFPAKYLAFCLIEKNEPWQIKELIPIGTVKNARKKN